MITYTSSVNDSGPVNLSDKFYGASSVVANHRHFQSFCIVALVFLFSYESQRK